MNKPNQLPEDVLRYIEFLENKNEEIKKAYQKAIEDLKYEKERVSELFKNIDSGMLGIRREILMHVTPLGDNSRMSLQGKNITAADLVNGMAEHIREWEAAMKKHSISTGHD